MFKIESYVTPILLSYVDKYVRDFKPEDAQVSLWGGGVALHNLVLKADVLQSELALPFTLVSGRIHELLIQVPWTKIISEPIVVTIDTIECVLSMNPPTTASPDEGPVPEPPHKPMEAPPGYMQALVRRVVSNISVQVQHLIVKYVQDDIVLSLNVKHLSIASADADWQPAFADIDPSQPMLRRLVQLDDLTLCLDAADADGKIRFFQEPLLYRCHLDLKVLTQLVSASTRRAKSVSVQVRCGRLAWNITSDQLTMLLRLYSEASRPPDAPPRPPAATTSSNTLTNTPEPAKSNSWSDWAWSWMPQWSDRETDSQPASARALPVRLAFYLDDMYAAFKVMELDKSMRRRARTVLELAAAHAALQCYLCKPVLQKCRFGVRDVRVYSRGRCVCGQMDYRLKIDEPIVYLSRLEEVEPWCWPELRVRPALERRDPDATQRPLSDLVESPEPPLSAHGQPEGPAGAAAGAAAEAEAGAQADEEAVWGAMSPLFYVEFLHERAPPAPGINPYEGPPTDFQYSDWVEECVVKVVVEPVSVLLCMGLFHRLHVIRALARDLLLDPTPDPPMRTLTVEEAEALTENLPERRISVQALRTRVVVQPWDHTGERARPSRVHLELHAPRTHLVLNGPLYPHRVCSAACQLPEDAGPLWQAARLHVSVTLEGAVARLAAGEGRAPPCARLSLRAALHVLLHPHYFGARERVHCTLSLAASEANLCGSWARLQAAHEILQSLARRRVSLLLRYTSLASDAINDDELVAIDLSAEELTVRAFFTSNTNTGVVTLQSAKATAFHEPKGQPLKQAWIFSAPDAPISTPYLRLAIQLCNQQLATSLDYVGIWTEPTAVCVDPLLIAWLAYKPVLMRTQSIVMEKSSSFTLLKRRSVASARLEKERATEKSSSGRGGSKSSIELAVHSRPRSASSSEKTEPPAPAPPPPQYESLAWWQGDRLLQLHERLRHMLVNVEFGLNLLYVTMSSASALDCETIRDAMERHAGTGHQVLVISLGRIALYSCALTKHFWQDIKHDGPTFVVYDAQQGRPESFPWRLRLADVSCYTLEVPGAGAGAARGGKRSQLKTALAASPRTVLELVTTTVTLSVVSKTLQIINVPKFEAAEKKPVDPKGQRTKYFTLGHEFKPTTLKEFVRGPLKRKKEKEKTSPQEKKSATRAPTTSAGPIVSLGVHVHADTPPISVLLERDQVQLVAATVHCFQHIAALVRSAVAYPQRSRSSVSLPALSPTRTVPATLDEYTVLDSMSSEDVTDSASDLIPLFVADQPTKLKHSLKTFFYFQWVVSRVSVAGTEAGLRLALAVEDVIATADLQDHYNQLRVNIASANIRHYERTSNEWVAGVLNGRVLEARETVDSQSDNHFLGVTITQARISTLPANWKEELHPKLLEQKNTNDTMWEIFLTLAPLEVLVAPRVMRQSISLLRDLAPRSFCPLARDSPDTEVRNWQWPFFYVSAGGLRLLLTRQQPASADDTVVLEVGSVTVTPHPDNPICRRLTVTQSDGTWPAAAAGPDGRQYEVVVSNLSLKTTQFQEIIKLEALQRPQQAADNPALKWAQPVPPPVAVSPLLHNVDISSVLAPALLSGGGALVHGPAVELNLVSDCDLEISVDQLVLLKLSLYDIYSALRESEEEFQILDRDRSRGVCAYAALIDKQESTLADRDDSAADLAEGGRGTDSGLGVEGGSSLKFQQFEELNPHLKKPASHVGFIENNVRPLDHLEVFVTMGVIRAALYMADDGSPEVAALRPPSDPSPKEAKMERARSERLSQSGSPKEEDEIKFQAASTQTRRSTDHIPLLHVSLWQPNLYFWRKKAQKTLQFSLFNLWVALGSGAAPLLQTARGAADPLTDIPPALATLKLVVPCADSTGNGSLTVDVERPVELRLSRDSLRRLHLIHHLMKVKTFLPEFEPAPTTTLVTLHPLYRFRKLMLSYNIETATVSTSQVSAVGAEGALGWDSSTLQVGVGSRPRRLCARALLAGAVVSAGEPDARQLILHPTVVGLESESLWESWRHAEGGLAYHVPGARLSLDADRVVVELRPADLARLHRLLDLMKEGISHVAEEHVPAPPLEKTPSAASLADATQDDHYYKDDLRSGAFKIVSGSMLPMAYQVTLHDNAVAWRYPHPRAITRLVACPLPGQDEETPCVLEMFSVTLQQWETHTYFSIPVGEPVETQIYVPPPDAVFSVMWRYRVYETEEKNTRFVFNHSRFKPRQDPLSYSPEAEMPAPRSRRGVTAAALAGAVRVDSCFSPRLAPRLRVVLRLVALTLHMHNDLPPSSRQKSSLEGYYVSKPLMRSHRVMRVSAADLLLHNNFGSPAGHLSVAHTYLLSDILDSSTGTMEPMVDEFRLQLGVSKGRVGSLRARVALGRVRAALHVPRLRTLRALANDWQRAYDKNFKRSDKESFDEEQAPEAEYLSALQVREPAEAALLEGRVALWVHNTSSSALRLGQEGTDEVVPLGPSTSLAYRWRCPSSPRKLRFSVAGPTDWQWSSSIPFAPGSYRVRLSEAEDAGGVHLHAGVEDRGARRSLALAGRLRVANMLATSLLYKVRSRGSDAQWRTLGAGELRAQALGPSVLCAADADLVFKIKFPDKELGWTGDIPLRQCPKENVPWLVKVPSAGASFSCVWCRVVRARSDSRLLVAVWPLYLLYSLLPLDVDVMIRSEGADAVGPAPAEGVRQRAPGRGACTQLAAPGTTGTRHTLSIQYSGMHSAVTAAPVPLHYGAAEASVFERRAPVADIEEVVAEIEQWLERCGPAAKSEWPFSIVTRHWGAPWQPSPLQPRSDVTVQYQGVSAGGGCALEVRLSPAVLLCNAAPLALTLRAHDAAPLCRLEPGAATAVGAALLQKPFYLSVEMGRETYVSSSLAVTGAALGRYGAPPQGLLALEHAAPLLVLCDHKAALLSMFYEIKEDINVLGISSTYSLVNRMPTNILVSAMAVPMESSEDIVLRPTTFIDVEPTPDNSTHGTPLCHFELVGRWRGGVPDELRLYVTLSLGGDGGAGAGAGGTRGSAPVRLGQPPLRRAVAVRDHNDRSVPIVVTQMKSEGQWVVVVSEDPCPQFVVRNRTAHALCVAQPVAPPAAGPVPVVAECAGTRWHCALAPSSLTHYSAPAHCARYPPAPAAAAPPHPDITFLTFAQHAGLLQESAAWCPPVAVAEGEQLVAVADGVTVKLRVRTHPHSTLIDLKDVNQSEISASDIRNRLFEAFTTSDVLDFREHSTHLERNNADNTLIIPEPVTAAAPPVPAAPLAAPAPAVKALDPSRIADSLYVGRARRQDSSSSAELLSPAQPSLDAANRGPFKRTVSIDTRSMDLSKPTDKDDYEGATAMLRRLLQLDKPEAAAVSPTSLSPATSDTNQPGPAELPVYQPPSSPDSPNLPDSPGSPNSPGSPGSPNSPDDDFFNSTPRNSMDRSNPTLLLFNEGDADEISRRMLKTSSFDSAADDTSVYRKRYSSDWNSAWIFHERLRLVAEGISLQLATADDERALAALHLDRAALVLRSGHKRIKTTITVGNVQIDNMQYETGQFDFAVVASTRGDGGGEGARWPPLWNPFGQRAHYASEPAAARALLHLTHDTWAAQGLRYTELTEVELRLGPLALYVEDAYVTALAQLARAVAPPRPAAPRAWPAEHAALRAPLRLRALHVHPLDMTLSLHTAIRMYIALDQSPLTLGAFRLRDAMTSPDRLTQALTVHYLSAAILGAGWVVGGLELLGAPGALAARLGGARGGVRGVASAAAAALLRSLSACAGSLARNLDLLAGDEEHAQRAMAARRRPPSSLLAGLAAGITNFAINILGAVGGLAHHPLVGVAVGESASGAAALRRGLLGALAKPLSATADLVAFAGHGLLAQTGWDPAPQARAAWSSHGLIAGWRRDCVRWVFRLADLDSIEGFRVLLDSAPLHLILTHKFMVLTELDTERVLEMIDLKNCYVHPYLGQVLEVTVTQRRAARLSEVRAVDEEDHELSAAARARVARYTGAAGGSGGAGAGAVGGAGGGGAARVLRVVPTPGAAPALHALLQALSHHNQPEHLSML